MNARRIVTMTSATAVLAVLAGAALSAQDRSTLQVPNGLAFAEFKGYETWQVISISQSDDLVAVIVGNPMMIDAYQTGIADNGKPFPDGAKMAKIHWVPKKSAEAPAPTIVPGALHDVDFMVKDSKRFADSGGWGYAEFDYDAGADAFKPLGSGANCGHACHTIVAKKDYVFTAFPKR
ncbi:MAG TPA: cytochrome P460 family protein [Casimicrobiaceae bacterium]|nr:cytochrome P460 family protein [Casimicrobiaceae bacterium]